MGFELKQHFQIEAARFLPHLPKDHPCAHMHGHSFKISLTFKGDLDPVIGWVVDYHYVTQLMKPILAEIDHKVLNDVPGLLNPTSENLSCWIFNKVKVHLSGLTSVNVSETPTTECIYTG